MIPSDCFFSWSCTFYPTIGNRVMSSSYSNKKLFNSFPLIQCSDMVWDTTYSLFQQCALGLSVHILVYDRNFGFGSVVRPNKSFGRVRWFGRNTVSVNRTDYRTFRHWLLEISKPKRKSNFSTRKICFWRKKWDKLILTTNLVPRRFNL